MNAASISTAIFVVAGLCWTSMGETLVSAPYGEARLESRGVRFAPRLFDKTWNTCKAKTRWMPESDGSFRFSILDGGAVVVEGIARQSVRDGRAELCWDFEVKQDFASSAFCIAVDLPTATFGGGEAVIGGKAYELPKAMHEQPWIGGGMCSEVSVSEPKGRGFSLKLAADAFASVQDDRKWGASLFAMRIAVGNKVLTAGERRSVALTVSTEDDIGALVGGSLTIEQSAEWVPIDDTTDVIPGSALDFSKLGWVDAPAGKHGRVVAKGSHFEFENMPGVPQRFYGCNLCFSANFLSERDADELCSRMARLGYNALRIHHYEQELCDPKDGTTILPAKMAELDNLLNACIRHGLYLTTDLFVSRPVKWRACGIDRDGDIPMDQFKELVLFDEKAFANYTAFARAFLCHVNPKTGRRWADEPALGFLALVNEGNPGNHGYGFMSTQPALLAKWRAWLAARRAESPAQYADITEKFPANSWENSRQNCAVALFFADLEIEFCERMRRFVRDEIGSMVLLTDMSCWKNAVAYQLTRTHYDYVDDHFYVDHPQFLEQSWRLPSKCPNVNPVRSASAGFESVAKHRLLDRPFTITEFNYSGPGQFRGVGGMMLGAQAALQGYDGIWRFAWSHSRDGVLHPQPMSYFDVARDPLQRATERAVLTLYMRRDLKPLVETFSVTMPERALRSNFDCGPQADIQDMWFGWYARFGTWIGEGRPPFATASEEFPKVYSMVEEDFRRLAGARRPGNGQVAIDRDAGLFAVDTACTQGFFAEGGHHVAGCLSATVSGAPAAVWVSSLDDLPIVSSSHILLTHVTDVQDTGTVYADRAKTILVKWGHLPHMMRAGRVEIALALSEGKQVKVYALAADGSRRAEIPSKMSGGRLSFVADTARDPSDATYLYEIVRPTSVSAAPDSALSYFRPD